MRSARNDRTAHTLARSAVAAAAVLVLASCSVTSSITEGDLESSLEEQIASTNPDASVESVDCPGSLDGEVDATLECTAVIDGAEYPVALTVTSVEGDTVNFDWEILEG